MKQGAESAGVIIAGHLERAATLFASGEQWAIAGEKFGQAALERLQATEISIRAQIGPISVTLTDNGLLEKLRTGLSAEIRDTVQEALNSRFNPDGTTIDPSLQTPFGPAGGLA
jgi:hypothetical protein